MLVFAASYVALQPARRRPHRRTSRRGCGRGSGGERAPLPARPRGGRSPATRARAALGPHAHRARAHGGRSCWSRSSARSSRRTIPSALVGHPAADARRPTSRSGPTTSVTTCSRGCSGAGAASSGWRSRRPRSASASARRSACSPGFTRSRLDDALMRGMDVILAFPQIVLVLLFVSMLGSKLWLIVAARRALLGAAGRARRARRDRRRRAPRVRRRPPRRSACRAAGSSSARSCPNVTTPLMVEYGLRLTWSIAVIAAISFLGFGIQPPNADWGLMINENRNGITLQPWAVVAPAIVHRDLRDRHELRHRGHLAGDRPRRRRGRRVSAAARRGPARRADAAAARSSTTSPSSSRRGEIVGLVGESGSGKTTVALALLGHARRGTRIARGSVRVGGVDLLALGAEALRAARGKLVAYVPQDPVVGAQPGAARSARSSRR